jgi:hypothetical protein
MNSPRMSHPVRPDVTAEQARDARARAWAYVFQCWNMKKGEQHELTSDSTKQWTTRTEQKGEDNADLHGD